MKCLENMSDIVYSEYDQFIRDVDKCRADMLAADQRLLSDRKVRIINFDDNFELADGRMVIDYKGVKFECFFNYKPTSKLYVFLNGALTQKRPQFARWSYYKFLNGSVLNIADPMYSMYDELLLGWYYGNRDYNLRIYVSEIVSKIADKLCVAYENVIFYGSSGGGAAVIECASHIRGAKAVSINPQIVLSEYSYANEFIRITCNDLYQDNKWHRNNGIFFIQNNNQSKHVILANIRCRADMQQIENVCRAMEIKTLKYGLNFYGDLTIWLYDCECKPYINAHNLQDNYCMCIAIEQLLDNIDNADIREQESSLCRYINEWWYAWWKQELYWRSRRPNLHFLLDCMKIQKKMSLFGTGDDAQKLCKELLDIAGENYYRIEEVFDNDPKKTGTVFMGITVMHPSQVVDWPNYYIIIASLKYAEDIRLQLETYNLSYQKDFAMIKDLYE